jgi:hypothetical protein
MNNLHRASAPSNDGNHASHCSNTSRQSRTQLIRGARDRIEVRSQPQLEPIRKHHEYSLPADSMAIVSLSGELSEGF